MKHSYSSINCFKNCPRQWEAKYLTYTYKDTGNEFNRWGTKVHSHFEARLKTATPLPPELASMEPIMGIVGRMPGTLAVEQKLAVNVSLAPTDYKAPDAYIRGIIDLSKIAGANAVVADYKTGKVRDDFYQLELSALLLMANFPDVQTVLTMFLWSKVGTFTKEEYNHLQKQNMWNKIVSDTVRIEQAAARKEFPPKRSGLCGWCHLHTCEFCTK